MKGPGMYPGMTVQRNGYKNMSDGKSESSAFQQNNKEKTFDDYMDEGFSPKEAKQMADAGASTGEVKKPSKKVENKEKDEVASTESPNKFLGLGMANKLAQKAMPGMHDKMSNTKLGGFLGM
jgi:hypothetical protein